MDVSFQTLRVPILLRLKWWGVLLLSLHGLVAGYLLLIQAGWTQPVALRWLLGAGLGALFILLYVRLHLVENRREGERHVLPQLGAANGVSIGRGLAYAGLTGFLFVPEPSGATAWLPAALFFVATVTDAFDGYLARAFDHTTRLGQRIDVAYDAFGLLIATTLGVRYGQLPAWYLLTGLAYYLFHLHRGWRMWSGQPVGALPDSRRRGIIGGFQAGFLCGLLWPIFEPPATTLAACMFAVPLTASFGRDWLALVGWIRRHPQRYTRLHRLISIVALEVVPVLARIAMTVLAAALLVGTGNGSVLLWTDVAVNTVQPVALAGTVVVLVLAALVALGAAGQVAAFLLLLLASLDTVWTGFTWANGTLLVLSLTILIYGTGPASVWKPSARLLHRRLA